MRLEPSIRCDVLVVGSGIAGCMAAICAAEDGARVCLASAGPLFSGSSFFEGTWGLGCIAPDGETDAEDLVATIMDVGCGCADETLARALAYGITPALADLERRGVRLRMPDAAGEREYIPCFDHTHRTWRGLERASLKQVFARELERLGVQALPSCTLVDLVEDDDGIAGAVLHDDRIGRALGVSTPAVVLATGGMGGLYGHHLTRGDCLGTAQAIALAHGEDLVNIEFLQIMPTVLTPAGPVVFNEKCFRFSTLSIPVDEDLLDERSTYGPFTSRLASSAVDLAIAQSADPVFVQVNRLPDPVPEFIATYRRWYEQATGLPIEAPVEIRPYAHASNGGIAIRSDASCKLPGLFACGECAGGMHGADRLGGLASASALVFGGIAGRSAASRNRRNNLTNDLSICQVSGLGQRGEIGQILDEYALVIRTEKGLAQAAARLEALAPSLERTSALALVSAMRARVECAGSHFRADAPAVCS